MPSSSTGSRFIAGVPSVASATMVPTTGVGAAGALSSPSLLPALDAEAASMARVARGRARSIARAAMVRLMPIQLRGLLQFVLAGGAFTSGTWSGSGGSSSLVLQLVGGARMGSSDRLSSVLSTTVLLQ